MSSLASHAATDVYESADDYDEVEFVTNANHHDWSQDCKTLAMTQTHLQNGWMKSRLLTKSGPVMEIWEVPRLS